MPREGSSDVAAEAKFSLDAAVSDEGNPLLPSVMSRKAHIYARIELQRWREAVDRIV